MEPELLLLADGPQLLQVVEGAGAGGAEGDTQEEGDEPASLSVLMASLTAESLISLLSVPTMSRM